MSKKDAKKVLLLGIICCLATAFIIRLFKPQFAVYFGTFPWINELAFIFLVVGIVAFIFERVHQFPFFYGKSQSGGSNANSFFLLGIGAAFLELSMFQFVIVLVGLTAVLYGLGAWINGRKTSDETNDCR